MSHIHNPDRSYLSPPPSTISISWSNELLYQGSSATWVDVDCLVGPAVVLLKVTGKNDGSAGTVYAVKGGTNPTSPNGQSVVCQLASAAVDNDGYLILPTDASGKIRVRTNHTAASIFIYRIGSWKCAMPRTVFHGALSPAAHTDLDLGVNNALCFIRIENLGSTSCKFYFRINGDTAADAWAANSLSLYVQSTLSTVDGYVVVMTDGAGIVEWMSEVPQEYRLTLEAYIPLSDVVPVEMFASGAIPGAWADLASSYGHCVIYAKGVGDNAGSWAKFRENGAANEMGNIPGATLFAAGTTGANERVYGLIICDYTGTSEWMQAGGGAHNMAVTKLARLG